MDQKKNQAQNHGHRQRLKDRFRKGGEVALADYEMLELLLYAAIPRRDVKPLAKNLINLFGSYAEVISASPERLSEVSGVGDNVITTIKMVEASARKMAQGVVLDQPILSNWQALVDYCQIKMAHKKTEEFHILFLDRKNRLIADEAQQNGTVDHTPVYPREVIKRALQLQSSAIILVHNHPSGDPTPSRNDLDMTKRIARAGEELNIKLHDHLIISKSGHTSFKTMGLI